MESPLLNFPQMVDMIFGTFESGIINIKMLHSFLHALMSQLSLDNVRVRLHGSNYEDLQSLMGRSSADVQIINYWFDPECPDAPKRIEVDKGVGEKYDKVILVQHNEKENQWLDASGYVEMPPIRDDGLIRMSIGAHSSEIYKEIKSSSTVKGSISSPALSTEHSISIQNSETTSSRLSNRANMRGSEQNTHESEHQQEAPADKRLSALSQRSVDKVLTGKFITLENIEDIKDKFLVTLDNAIQEMSKKIRDLQTDFCKIETEIKFLHSKQNDLEDYCHENDRRIELLDKDLQKVNKTLVCLRYEVQDIVKVEQNRHHKLEVLREELNSIKCIKADQAAVDFQLESKANKTDVAKKFSYTTFEPVRKHLTCDLIAVQEKIIHQETKLQQKIMQLSIQVARECENVKEHFTSVIDKIREKCQQLETNVSALKEVQVTAASTNGYMPNLNCLACAEKAKMKRSQECLPMQEPFTQQLNKSRFERLKFVDEREQRIAELKKQHFAIVRHSNYFQQNRVKRPKTVGSW